MTFDSDTELRFLLRRTRSDRPLFCFTLDTEPDGLWQDNGVTFQHFDHLFDFHKDLVRCGARPTYLTTSEVAEDRRAAREMGRILEDGNAELAAHFHTWTRSWPFPVPEIVNPQTHACAHQLGQEVEERMLEFTCRTLDQVFGFRPVSYRGGRWSLNGASARSLRNCGIHVDSTVTPGLDWRDTGSRICSGPDFRRCPRHPFYLSADSLAPCSDGEILEIPVGASFLPNRQTALRHDRLMRAVRKLQRVFRRPCGVLWLRPTTMTRAQLRACLYSLHQDMAPVWVAIIHSSEIIPNPHLPTEEDVVKFRRRCLTLVEDAMDMGALGVTLSEASDACRKLKTTGEP